MYLYDVGVGFIEKTELNPQDKTETRSQEEKMPFFALAAWRFVKNCSIPIALPIILLPHLQDKM